MTHRALPAEWTADTLRAAAAPDHDEPLTRKEEETFPFSARPGRAQELLLGACILLFCAALAVLGVWGLIERLRP